MVDGPHSAELVDLGYERPLLALVEIGRDPRMEHDQGSGAGN
jgi:hypothetical protein